jgi:peptidoglycan/xylan/chitin deacetylase (PgdA/CDA1 family)
MTASLRERLARKLSESLTARIPVAEVEMELPRGVLSVCFDDFPRTAWTVGGDLLKELGVKGTYYVSGSLRGRRFGGVQQFEEDDVAAAYEAGHEIGCHTFDHLAGTRHSTTEYLASIERNGQFLRERLPGWVRQSFCYPWGLAPLRVRRAVTARFGACRSTVAGLNRRRTDRSLLRAIGLERCSRRNTDVIALIEEAARSRAWLIIYTHDVSERHSDYGCTPAELERAIRAALAAGLEIRPIGAIIAGRMSHPAAPTTALRSATGIVPSL